MANHIKLTDEERVQVAEFWGDYFRNGGEGRQPTAFQLDAVNDQHLRDAFMFWQIDGDPLSYNDGFPLESVAAMAAFGPAPAAEDALKAMVTYMRIKNEEGIEVDDIDTGSVFVLMHIMWLALGGDFQLATFEASTLSKAVVIYQMTEPENVYPHSSPLGGLGMAAYMLGHQDRETALKLSAQMFGLAEDHPNTCFARERALQRQLEQVIEEEERKNDAA